MAMTVKAEHAFNRKCHIVVCQKTSCMLPHSIKVADVWGPHYAMSPYAFPGFIVRWLRTVVKKKKKKTKSFSVHLVLTHTKKMIQEKRQRSTVLPILLVSLCVCQLLTSRESFVKSVDKPARLSNLLLSFCIVHVQYACVVSTHAAFLKGPSPGHIENFGYTLEVVTCPLLSVLLEEYLKVVDY